MLLHQRPFPYLKICCPDYAICRVVSLPVFRAVGHCWVTCRFVFVQVMEIIPTAQHMLDNYDALTIAEKNRLWKLVMKKATVYRTPNEEMSVHIYPKLPK